jgi:hypothetical protein
MQRLSKISKVLGTIATVATLTTALSSAANAQVNFGTSSDGPGASLQEQLDALDAGIDTVNDESGAETFQTIGKGVRSFLFFEIAGFAPFNTVGIYNSNGDIKELFTGADGNDGATRSRWIGQRELRNDGFDEFGLYLTNKKGQTFYSETSKNADGQDYFLAYQGSGQVLKNIDGDLNPNRDGDQTRFRLRDTDYLFAWEDLPWSSSDKDYNDFVGVIRNVEVSEDVPEPASMLGLAAIAGSVFALRRRQTA